MKQFRNQLGPLAVGVVVLAGLVYAFLPAPVPVELATVTCGPIERVVIEDGRTRIKERYVVAAPLAGRLLRVTLKAGDTVEANAAPVAVLIPVDPDPLDARTRAQAEARSLAADAALEQAAALWERAKAAQALADKELDRARQLHATRTLPREQLDRAEYNQRATTEELKAAGFAVQIARYEVELARAALLFSQSETPPDPDSAPFEIRSPIDGRVLRVFQESATVVLPGTPLIELGDPSDLEVEIDVLSPDAVRIRPGARVQLEHWGGERPLEGRVRRIEPAGFTKISALGVEEQRVWVLVDLLDPPAAWQDLGDAFRVEARLTIAEADQALKLPAGALFRREQAWNVFVVEDGRARPQTVTVGLRNDLEAQVVEGLQEGDQVVVHPSDRVRDGVRVRTVK
jgi:HlyD family secretion protein